jgi:molybdopterin molybdotransferase
MISVQEAMDVLNANIPSKTIINLPLERAFNHCLAKDIQSPIHMPPFRQSIMDGYALNLHASLSYVLKGEIKAGDGHQVALKPGEAIKIFTGAAVPDSTNSVIQIEKTTLQNGHVVVKEMPLVDSNIRQIGQQIKQNEIALSKGTFLNPAAIGFLAGLGVAYVDVYQKPTVGIMVTGNELTKYGTALEHGKVYESNSIMLKAALQDANFNELNTYYVNDDFAATKKAIEKALEENDVLLISGGISVGDYDFVKRALDDINVEVLFYKVNQKPGKPLLLAKKAHKLIFALPGNPGASLTCYYVYVQPTLHVISGTDTTNNKLIQKEIAHNFVINNTRSQFLKAIVNENGVTILGHQESSMLRSYAVANCLVYVREGEYEIGEGSMVNIYPI